MIEIWTAEDVAKLLACSPRQKKCYHSLMKAAIWYFVYLAIGIGVWVFYQVTTRDEREEWMWQTITFFLAITGAMLLWQTVR